MAAWFVYLLECADSTYYCGITTDLERRVCEHNAGGAKGAKYTRARLPVRLVAHARASSRSEAGSLEARVKKLPRSRKVDFLQMVDREFADSGSS